MRIGVDYYPEQWSEKRWKTDLELMNKANIKVVRIGEFSWSLYEPQEGEFDFAWMDKILDTLRKYNISAVLCTPSATPPKWMVDKYPQILQEDVYDKNYQAQENTTVLTVVFTVISVICLILKSQRDMERILSLKDGR